mmetsp:Transcript_33254/g.56910  ORF Transcript_33254/g.56910 Transcript_33254/m.56910 type:complete len:200 (-) Transcript_33254:266-865(-)
MRCSTIRTGLCAASSTMMGTRATSSSPRVTTVTLWRSTRPVVALIQRMPSPSASSIATTSASKSSSRTSSHPQRAGRRRPRRAAAAVATQPLVRSRSSSTTRRCTTLVTRAGPCCCKASERASWLWPHYQPTSSTDSRTTWPVWSRRTGRTYGRMGSNGYTSSSSRTPTLASKPVWRMQRMSRRSRPHAHSPMLKAALW